MRGPVFRAADLRDEVIRRRRGLSERRKARLSKSARRRVLIAQPARC